MISITIFIAVSASPVALHPLVAPPPSVVKLASSGVSFFPIFLGDQPGVEEQHSSHPHCWLFDLVEIPEKTQTWCCKKSNHRGSARDVAISSWSLELDDVTDNPPSFHRTL